MLQGTQDKLVAAREEVHTQKRQLAAQLKDEVLRCPSAPGYSAPHPLMRSLPDYALVDVTT